MKVKNCPFCDGDNIKIKDLGSFGKPNETPVLTIWLGVCGCGAQMMAHSRGGVIEKWNRRAGRRRGRQ